MGKKIKTNIKNKGFTLIELLATILILAVIALITVPIILNIVQKSRKKAFEVGVLSLFDALEFYSLNNIVPEKGITTTPEGLKDVPIENVAFTGGTIKPYNNSFNVECVTNGTYYAIGSKENLKVYKDRCGVAIDDDKTSPIINVVLVDNINIDSFRVVLNVTEEETYLTYYYSLNKDSLKKVYETGVCDDDCIESDKNYHTFTGLNKNTNYDVYVLVKDAANNYNESTSLGIDGTPVSKYDREIKTKDFNLPSCAVTKTFIGLEEGDYEVWGTSKEVACTFDISSGLNSYYKVGSEDWKPINQSSLVFMIDEPYQTIYVKTNEMLGQILTVGKIDNVKPSVPILSGGGTWTKETTTILANSTDNESGVNSYQYLECPTNSLCDISNVVSVAGVSAAKAYTNEGTSYVFVRSRDNVGNYSDWQLNSQVVRIDKTKPTVTFNPESKSADSEAKNAHSTIPTIKETLSGIKTCKYVWNTNSVSPTTEAGFTGENCTNNTSITTPTGLARGQYYLHVYITDNAGNMTIDKADGSFNVDNTKPVCVWTASPSSTNLKNSSTATYKITCTDSNELKDSSITAADIEQIKTGNPNASISVSAPSMSGTTYVYTVTLNAGTGDGTIALRLKAGSVADYADNTNNVSGNSTSITIDNTKPVITVNPTTITITEGTVYTDAGVTASDAHSGINGSVTSSGTVNPNIPGTYTITYTVSDKAGNEATATRTVHVIKGDYNIAKRVNRPVLTTGMTPIKWNGTTEVTTNENDSDWYDYNTKKWANAKTADGSYWVWIPRYIYNITSGWHSSTAGTIEIQFSKGTNDNWNSSSIGNIDTGITSNASNNKWTNHPAFTFGDKEVTGFWVAKFTATASEGVKNGYTADNSCPIPDDDTSLKTILIQPTKVTWRCISIGNVFTNVRNMETKSIYGWATASGLRSDGTYINDTNGIDTHLMKNIEWGAIAYLSKSKYGKNIDEVWINPANDYTTGCAGSTASSVETVGCYRTYETPIGQKASTTGNINGVYDMSGGSWERVAAYVNNGNGNLGLYGPTLISSNIKYRDVYTASLADNQPSNYELAINKKGDAVYETSLTGTNKTAWFGDYSSMTHTTNPWFLRSVHFSYTTEAGAFAFATTNGLAHSRHSFRPVLMVKAGL